MAVDILATAAPQGTLSISENTKMVGKWLAAGAIVGFIAKSVAGSALIGATAGVGTIAILAYATKEHLA
jgi:hypothetical protein